MRGFPLVHMLDQWYDCDNGVREHRRESYLNTITVSPTGGDPQ